MGVNFALSWYELSASNANAIAIANSVGQSWGSEFAIYSNTVSHRENRTHTRLSLTA